MNRKTLKVGTKPQLKKKKNYTYFEKSRRKLKSLRIHQGC